MPDIASGLIRVPHGMGVTGPALMSIAGQIRTVLDDLRSYLAPYVGGVDWQGRANVPYSELQRRWDLAADDLMNSTLHHLGNTVNINWQNNVMTEDANTRMWAH